LPRDTIPSRFAKFRHAKTAEGAHTASVSAILAPAAFLFAGGTSVRAGGARFGRADLLRAVGLSIFVCVVWGAAYGRTSPEALATPIAYRGDAWFLLAYLKAAQDGRVVPGHAITVPELNAPFEANWNDHPRPLRAVFFLAGLLARRLGLFATANLLLLLAHVLAALSFYGVARYFRARWEWAAAGAAAFGLSHFLFWRSIEHLDLSLAWHLPLCVLVVTWVFRRKGLPLRSRRFAAAAVITAVTALHNPYYSILFAQFLLLAAAAQAFRSRGVRTAAAPLALVLLLATFFVLDQAGSLAYEWQHGANPGAVRPYGNLERYALKPMELLVAPPGFGLGNWGILARSYWEGQLYRGERGSPYLGLLGAGGLLWMGFLAFRSALRRPVMAPPAALLATAWIVLYSVVGGLNEVVGLFGFLWLRATNRYSVWILALVLLWLTVRLSRHSSGGRKTSVAAAAAVTLLAVADQVPNRAMRTEVHGTRLLLESDRQFVRAVESAAPAGAMIFMLPVTAFPEGRPLRGCTEYEHLRPYLFSSSLHFSFGSDKGRPREAWQRKIEAMPTADMANALERYGFSGLVINRHAYVRGGVDLLAELAATGRPPGLADTAGDLVYVPLHPVALPARPGVPVLFGRGWRDGDEESSEGRWSTGEAEWVLTNESSRPLRLRASFDLGVERVQRLTIRMPKQVVFSAPVRGALSVPGLALDLPPGETRLVFASDQEAERAPGLDGKVSFRLSRLVLRTEGAKRADAR
jgi:phosphoglycerol transferase